MAKLTGLPLLFCSLLLASLSVSMVAAQQTGSAEARSCSTVITSCGCVITKSDTYIVDNDLSAEQTSKPNCIEIAASYSILNLKGFSVIGFGNGSGIGILIRKGADHVVVEGSDEGGAAIAADSGMRGEDFPAAQAVVTGWDIGIQDDADDAAIELFKDIGGNIFQQHNGNATAGVFLNGVQRSIAADLHASYNGQVGVMVKESTAVNLFNLSAIGNHQTGIWLDSSNGSTIGTASAAGNGKYGMWLSQSSRNLIVNCNGTSGNSDIGILLGCGDGDCNGNRNSNNNRITNSGAPGNH
jgi:parallel beta-helix repeat protein